jgi:hypothetical protein
MYHEYPPAERQEPNPGPRSSRGRYLENQSGLWFLTKPDDPNDPGEWVSDTIKPLAKVYIETPALHPLGEWAVEVEFSQADGSARRILIRYDRLHTAGREVIANFARAGMRVAADRKGHERFLNYLARIRPPTLLRLGELTVQGVKGVLCLRTFDLAPECGEYAPHAYQLYDLYDGGRKLPQVLRIVDDEDSSGDVI